MTTQVNKVNTCGLRSIYQQILCQLPLFQQVLKIYLLTKIPPGGVQE